MAENEQTTSGALPPEAGFSMSFQMRDGFGAVTTLTMRAAKAADWPEVMRARQAFMEAAMSKGGWQVMGQTPATPPQTQAPSPVMGGFAPSNAQVPVQPPVPTNGNGNGEGDYIVATRMVVRPEPDGRVSLEFYAQGHQYPDLKASKWPVAKAAAALQAVTAQDLTRPADLALAGPGCQGWRVAYKLGKEKPGGGNYKDIVGVMLA